MVVVNCQRPALEELEPGNLDGFWLKSTVFQGSKKLRFWLEDSGQGKAKQVEYRGVSDGHSVYALREFKIAGFSLSSKEAALDPSELVDCAYAVLVEGTEDGDVEITLLKPSRVDEGGSVTKVFFIRTERKTRYRSM